MNKIEVWVDLDGVLAAFHTGVIEMMPHFIEGKTDIDKNHDREMWKAISKYQKKGGRFWEGLPLMPDAMILWDYVEKYNPQILSACGEPRFEADQQKRIWVVKHFGRNVRINLVRRSVEKAQYATPNGILIDDKMKSIQPWIDAGGVGILHGSAEDTIDQLQQLNL